VALNHSSLISNKSVRVNTVKAALLDLGVLVTDIGNPYLNVGGF
jgi:hypothetical protein